MRHIKRYTQLFENTQELTQEQKDWLDKCTNRSWKVNPETGLVDVKGYFDCGRQGLDSFKDVRFGTVSGSFYCSNNSLTSLEGGPQSVGMHFDCSNNSLTSLEGAPQSVGGYFNCYNNSLTSLGGAPLSVGGRFDCSRNSLTSLEGGPQSVGMHFGCSNNPLTSLKGAPQSVDGNFYCEDTSLTSLEGAPRKVGGHVHCTGNPISERAIMDVLKRMSGKEISLEQAVKGFWRYIPEEDRLYLAKHNPNLSPEDKRGYEALFKFRDKII